MDADVVIVGAGLAGVSAAAVMAAHSRAHVLIIERLGVGSNNPTPMTFSPALNRFGLESCAIGRYNRFTFHSPLGGSSTHAFEGSPLVALDYQAASQLLLERAQSAGNVEIVRAAASGLVRRGRDWLVSLNNGQQARTPLLIDASGRGLFTHRMLGLPRPASFSHCYGARLSNVSVPDPNEAFFMAPYPGFGNGGGWLYPLSGNRVSFGYANLGNQPGFPGGEVKENFQRALTEFEPYATWLKDAVWDHVEAGSIPIYPLRRFVWDGLLIAGDAAGQATIWSCMGSEAALEAGKLAAEAALQALQRGDYSAQTLGGYQQAWDQQYRRIYQHNAWIAPVVWSMTAEEWNRQIPRVQTLPPERMLDRLRINWPVPTVAQAAFVRAYDLAGRTRRGLVKRIRTWFKPAPACSAFEP